MYQLLTESSIRGNSGALDEHPSIIESGLDGNWIQHMQKNVIGPVAEEYRAQAELSHGPKQWLDLVARSGTVLFVSPEPKAVGEEQRQALRDAFQVLLSAEEHVRPIEWQTTTTPDHWEFGDRHRRGYIQRKYNWYQNSGAWPFDV